MIRQHSASELRKKRLPRIRNRLATGEKRPRLVFMKSNTALSVQLIDDVKHVTFFSLRVKGKNSAAAVNLASDTVSACKSKKVTRVVFDRSGFKYHGVVKIFADGVRQGGVVI